MTGLPCLSLFVLTTVSLSVSLVTSLRPLHVYHNYTSLTGFLNDVTAEFPDLTHLYSIGQSVQGRQLWVMAVGRSPTSHTLLQPELQYVGNMHGNEAVSRELLVHLIYHLASSYSTNSTIRRLLDSARVHILVTMNPDGSEVALAQSGEECFGEFGRGNANGVDLNRNFPDQFVSSSAPHEPETLAVMDWIRQHQFVLSANLHGGALVANYPYDSYPHAFYPRYSRSTDDELFIHLSKVYSFSHPTMHLGRMCPRDNFGFSDGITNGARWYPLTGGIQDYLYTVAGCMDITLEIACCKYPRQDNLSQYWELNRDPLINYLLEGFRGVKGVVRYSNETPVIGARIEIEGRDQPAYTTELGEYWRVLLPGQYTLSVITSDAEVHREAVTVYEDHTTVTNITLSLSSSTAAHLIYSSLILPALITAATLLN